MTDLVDNIRAAGGDLVFEPVVAVRKRLRRGARGANQVPAGRKKIAHGFNRGRE